MGALPDRGNSLLALGARPSEEACADLQTLFLPPVPPVLMVIVHSTEVPGVNVRVLIKGIVK